MIIFLLRNKFFKFLLLFDYYCVLFFLHQILILYDSLHVVDVNKIVEYIQSLQKEDGSFAGDEWGNF